MKTFCHKPLLSLLVIIFTTSNLISPSLSDPQTQNLINKICRTTSDFAFCLGILERNLISPKTDLAGLTRLTVSLSLSFARDTEIYIQKSKAAEKNANVGQLYDLCEGDYHKVVGFMEGANYDANRGDFESMVNLLSLCSKPIILCQNAIGGVVPDMRDKNRQMRVLLSMGLYEGTIF